MLNEWVTYGGRELILAVCELTALHLVSTVREFWMNCINTFHFEFVWAKRARRDGSPVHFRLCKHLNDFIIKIYLLQTLSKTRTNRKFHWPLSALGATGDEEDENSCHLTRTGFLLSLSLKLKLFFLLAVFDNDERSTIRNEKRSIYFFYEQERFAQFFLFYFFDKWNAKEV